VPDGTAAGALALVLGRQSARPGALEPGPGLSGRAGPVVLGHSETARRHLRRRRSGTGAVPAETAGEPAAGGAAPGAAGPFRQPAARRRRVQVVFRSPAGGPGGLRAGRHAGLCPGTEPGQCLSAALGILRSDPGPVPGAGLPGLRLALHAAPPLTLRRPCGPTDIRPGASAACYAA